jgi:integrase
MKFPVVIRHRGQKAKIYGKTPAYPFYRLAYKAAGKRHVRSFKTYSEAKQAGDQIVRDLAQGSQSAALTAGQAADALTAFELLQAFHRQTGRAVSLKRAVADYVEAARQLNGHTLAEVVEGYLSTVATVKRKDLSKAVEDFCKAREPKAVAGPGKRSALSPVYVADTARQLREFAATFPGHAVCDLGKEHLAAFIGARGNLSSKSRNHFRATLRMFLGWCARNDILARNHRLFEADSLQKEPMDEAPIDFYRPDELRALLENCDDDMRPVIAVQALAGLRLQEALRLDWREVFGIEGHIEVTTAKSKTRARRLVPICPALAEWLQAYRNKEGNVTSQTLDAYTWKLIQLRKRLKIPSRKNGLRHGFVTFHYALHGNENLTAQAAGHSPSLLHRHYRGLSTKSEGEKWFAVKPTETAENVIPLVAVEN